MTDARMNQRLALTIGVTVAEPFYRKFRIYQRNYLKYDLTAGVVVFLVAIPLCLGIALASGAPLFSGIIAGIIGGIIVGSISQSSVSVSGPAAGLVAVVIAAISQLGNFNTFLLALMLAGLFQIIIGSLRAGFIADYVPSSVIQGLLSAIGVLIIIKQLPLAFTHVSQNALLMQHLREAAGNLSIEPLYKTFSHLNAGATFISVLSLICLIFFDKTKIKYLKAIPGPIVVVIIGILINELYAYIWPAIEQTNAQLVNIPVNDHFSELLSQFEFPAWAQWKNPLVYFQAAIIATVASLESLLNLEAAEKLDSKRRYTSRNRELVAQGVGNTVAGLIGGIPVTSVVVRSSVNIQTGAKTKFSTILHGFLILTTVILVPNWLNAIPLASLATILIFVGFKLTHPKIYKSMFQRGWTQFIPFLVTVIAIVLTNLLFGILIGLFVGFFFILKTNSQIRLDIVKERHSSGIVTRIILPQQISFLHKASLISELNSIPEQSHLIIDARYSKYIDRDILELINEFRKNQSGDKNIAVNLVGFKDHYKIHDHIDFIDVTTYDIQSTLTPNDVLKILKEGNERFLKDQKIHRNLLVDLKATSKMQHPVAVVLSCIDSRVPVETVFDMGVGDVFVIRIAGNVLNEDIIASIEFACDIYKVKLILVLGHTRCGAIKAACGNQENRYLEPLFKKIKPAILAETQTTENRTIDNDGFLLNVTKLNIKNSMHALYEKSSIVKQLIRDKKIGLISAIYNVRNGMVSFDQDFYEK